MKSDKPEKADVRLRKALERDAGRAEAHYYRGVRAFARGDEVDAQTSLERCLELEPRSSYAADAHYLLASVAMEQSEKGDDPAIHRARARAHLEKFLEIRPKSPRTARAHFLLRTIALADGSRFRER